MPLNSGDYGKGLSAIGTGISAASPGWGTALNIIGSYLSSRRRKKRLRKETKRLRKLAKRDFREGIANLGKQYDETVETIQSQGRSQELESEQRKGQLLTGLYSTTSLLDNYKELQNIEKTNLSIASSKAKRGYETGQRHLRDRLKDQLRLAKTQERLALEQENNRFFSETLSSIGQGVRDKRNKELYDLKKEYYTSNK